jgi:hypothetical protein
VLHYASWAWGKPGASSATTASSTVPPGRVGGKSYVALIAAVTAMGTNKLPVRESASAPVVKLELLARA